VKDRSAADWEELAQQEPYFAVLTDPHFLGMQHGDAAFFESGENEVAALLAQIATLLGREVPLGAALDFGCGVGRLTLPLARRAGRVVGCDVAPTMLAHARQNAANAGWTNVTFVQELPQHGAFDFVLSLIVFQHIPVQLGSELIRTLLRLLASDGVAALHVTFERPGGWWRRTARNLRARSRLLHRILNVVRREKRHLPYMQMNEYDERVLQRDIEAAGARIAGRIATRHGDTAGAVLIIEKPRDQYSTNSSSGKQ
jgi:2-polyprenyl-3-methyl-5-hydroxy-6-metoxy-1,4-benzoquinol methylase